MVRSTWRPITRMMLRCDPNRSPPSDVKAPNDGRDPVKLAMSAVLGLSTLLAVGCRAPEPAPQANREARPAAAEYAVMGAAPCTRLEEIQFVCGLASPEDLAILPGSEWVIASGNREGGRLHLIDVRKKTSMVLFPTANRNERLDATTFPTCPGPLDLQKVDAFRAHGLYLKPGAN